MEKSLDNIFQLTAELAIHEIDFCPFFSQLRHFQYNSFAACGPLTRKSDTFYFKVNSLAKQSQLDIANAICG